MKLFEVPRNTRVMTRNGDQYNFKAIDGMYSYCTTDKGEVIHLAAWTEVEIVDKDREEPYWRKNYDD